MSFGTRVRARSGSIWSRRDTEISLIIADDGQGVDLDALEIAGADADDRYGIRGMKERVALIGGRLEISSQAGQGTSVRLKAPVEGQEDGTSPDL